LGGLCNRSEEATALTVAFSFSGSWFYRVGQFLFQETLRTRVASRKRLRASIRFFKIPAVFIHNVFAATWAQALP
jgi:hypothetical protein